MTVRDADRKMPVADASGQVAEIEGFPGASPRARGYHSNWHLSATERAEARARRQAENRAAFWAERRDAAGSTKARAMVTFDRLRGEITSAAREADDLVIEQAWRTVLDGIDDIRAEVAPLLGIGPVGDEAADEEGEAA